MKNKLTDLNNHLFMQLERLNNEELMGEGLAEEINRSKAVTSVSNAITNNARLLLNAAEFAADYPMAKSHISEIIGVVEGGK